MDGSTRYGLRARQMRKKQDAAADVASSPEAEATIAVGLKPKVLTKQELQLFGNSINEYLEVRSVSGGRLWRLKPPLAISNQEPVLDFDKRLQFQRQDPPGVAPRLHQASRCQDISQ